MSGIRIRPRIPLPLSIAVLAATLWSGCSDAPDSVVAPTPSTTATGSAAQTVAAAASATAAQSQEIAEAIRAQERHTPRLMQMPGVVGTGVSVNPQGLAVVKIFTVEPDVAGLPDRLDDVPVRVEMTGRFFAEPLAPYSPPAAVVDAAYVVGVASLDREPAPVDLGPATAVAAVDASSTTDRWARPVPIGVSTGHPDITAGTIGARVTNGTNVFALSNNHVYGKSNDANIGDPVIQPGSVDGGSSPADDIGTLADYYPIVFNDAGAQNTMDAAIALSSTSELDTSTPTELGGYGTPSSDIYGDANDDGSFDDRGDLLNLSVKKFGRTTGPTQGTVAEVNVTVDVCYDFFCFKIARFVDQISITPGDFSDGGDSGSLIVSASGNHPVALLFAGSSTRTIGNRIDLVLNHFNVDVDGTTDGGDGGGSNSPPTANDVSASGDEDSTISWTPDVSDADGDPLTCSISTQPSNGSAGVQPDCSAGSYTPSSDFNGNDSFVYSVSDGNGGSDTGTVTVTVNAVNDAPVAEDDSYSTEANTTLSVVAPGVLGNDDDVDGDALTAQLGTAPTSGSLTLNQNGSFDYTPNTDFEGTDQFTYTAFDGALSSVEATVTLTVTSASTAAMHVGDLDGSSQKMAQGNWEATVTVSVHDASHAGVPDVTVEGEFHQNGFVVPGSCVTDVSGTCSIDSGQMPHKSGTATFVVTAVTGGTLTYGAADNHDPDGDSDGTTIELSK